MGHKYQPIPRQGEIHEKAWGHELWIVNHELYCGKLLVFEKESEHSKEYYLYGSQLTFEEWSDARKDREGLPWYKNPSMRGTTRF